MATLTITLDDETFARLLERAASAEVEAEVVATALITSGLTADATTAVSPEVSAIIARQVEQFRPLFQRLAQ